MPANLYAKVQMFVTLLIIITTTKKRINLVLPIMQLVCHIIESNISYIFEHTDRMDQRTPMHLLIQAIQPISEMHKIRHIHVKSFS